MGAVVSVSRGVGSQGAALAQGLHPTIGSRAKEQQLAALSSD